MAESLASRNERVADYVADITHVSIHSIDPGPDGLLGELSSGGYARQAPTFDPPSGGATDLAGAGLSYSVPGGALCAFYGLWKGSTFLYSQAFDTPETFGNPGVLLVESLPITA
jgi:hypothetical protein